MSDKYFPGSTSHWGHPIEKALSKDDFVAWRLFGYPFLLLMHATDPAGADLCRRIRADIKSARKKPKKRGRRKK